MTALTLVFMLGLGALFLSWSQEYAAGMFSLLFGEVLGVSNNQVLGTAVFGVVCIAAIAILYRPLLLSSVAPPVAEARGIPGRRMEMCFLIVVAVATTMSVPVVGALLMFSLMIGAPGAACLLTDKPVAALDLSVAISMVIVWIAIAASYLTDWPVGFFVGTLAAVFFVAARAWAVVRQSRVGTADWTACRATRHAPLGAGTEMSTEPA
jgi:zinc/manganese transport system permease protein